MVIFSCFVQFFLTQNGNKWTKNGTHSIFCTLNANQISILSYRVSQGVGPKKWCL